MAVYVNTFYHEIAVTIYFVNLIWKSLLMPLLIEKDANPTDETDKTENKTQMVN